MEHRPGCDRLAMVMVTERLSRRIEECPTCRAREVTGELPASWEAWDPTWKDPDAYWRVPARSQTVNDWGRY